ncbi:hypothetical protein GE09DRAFT_1178171 [Coniochaeta sp. 2T2.1]|nr:hypothetical protein GE09DRAFT_1178171 [Coniochaeta sp. 2T2.1]
MVIGLVFYGRRELVRILDCYLKRNLRENGGVLDEVVFAINTDDQDDLAYLEDLLKTSPKYSKHVPQGEYDSHWWFGNWEAVSERDAVYVKIDDDVVFVEDDTISTIVNRLVDNPQYFAVSANVVNNPALSWVHNRLGVYEPYWPEMKKPVAQPPRSWRASELPAYDGPAAGPEGFDPAGSTPAPYQGHRWLPVRLWLGEAYNITTNPASTLTYDPFGPSLHNWAAGAQTHYSFLHHLEQRDTYKYKFDTWDYLYERLSINFLALRGGDILDVFPFPQSDDEDYLTRVRSKELGRRVIVDGTGLAVHFAFGPQRKAHDGHGLAWTDALDRYGAYADEKSRSGMRFVTRSFMQYEVEPTTKSYAA